MRNYIRFTTLLVLLSSIFAACDKKETPLEKLQAPVPVVSEKTSASFTVSWESVKDAVGYEYEFMDETKEVQATTVSFENLEPATYTFKVRALAENPSENSNWGEVKVTLQEGEDPEFTFGMVTELDGLSLTVTTTPSDKDVTYYFDVLTADIFAESDNDPEMAYSKMIEDFALYFGGKDKVYDQIDVRSGDTEKTFALTNYNATFYVLIAGVDRDMNITTKVEMAEVVVGRAGESDNTFTVEQLEIGVDKIQLKIVPSNNDEYAYVLIDTKSLDDYYGSLEDFVSTKFGPDSFSETYTGERTVLYEQNIKPASRYTFLVFGWAGGITTDVCRTDIITKDSAPSTDLTFEMEATVIASDKIQASIYPSDKEAVYYWNIITKTEYEKYKDDLSQYVIDVCEQWGVPVGEYMYQFGSVGDERDVVVDRLTPSTEYIMFAVGAELEGDDFTFFEPQVYDEPLVTFGVEEEPLTFSTLEITHWRDGLMYVYIFPRKYDAPYIFEIVSVEDYETYSDNFNEYVRVKAENAGMSLTDYLNANKRTGAVDEILEESYPVGEYYLVAAGISSDGTRLLKEQISDYTAEVD